MPPTAPPTSALLSLRHTNPGFVGAEGVDIGNAEPVDTAVPYTDASDVVEDVVLGRAVAATASMLRLAVDVEDWNAPSEEVVKCGAVALLQQLRSSPAARQQ